MSVCKISPWSFLSERGDDGIATICGNVAQTDRLYSTSRPVKR